MAAGKVGKRLDVSPLRCLLLPFPPFHIAGLLGIGVALLAGGKVILMERFSPPGMLELIEKEKVTQIGGSPTMYLMLLRTPGQERYDLTSVKRITFSTETCPPDLARRLYERFGCTLENMYSTTESLLISWTGAEDGWEKAATTVGRPVPGAQVRIVDDRRQPLPVGQQGEIAVKTATIMTGYYGDPALTAQVLDDEGWYYTGDIGFLGKDGYLRLAGRKKDLILRGGEKFSPIEVESYLETHPAIRRTAVIGVPNKLGTQSVWAYVELQPGARLSAGEINGYCQGQLAPFKIPEQVRFIEQLPLTLLGKVQKFKLHQLAAQEQPAE
jgi:acyl-CoA synthetase (AMP-forming)/AMP-acid ligase II